MKPLGRPARRIAGLRRLREARHLTLAEVVEQTGISRSWLEQLEYGNVAIGVETAFKLAAYYNVATKEIEQAQATSRRAAAGRRKKA